MQIHDTVVSPLHWAVKDGKLDMARVSVVWRSSGAVEAFRLVIVWLFEAALWRNLRADGQGVKGAFASAANSPYPFPSSCLLLTVIQ